MIPEDPLLRNTANDPLLVPPVTPEAVTPRHAIDRQLVDPAGEPVGLVAPVAGPNGPALAAQIKAVNDQRKVDVALLAAGIVAVLIFTLLVAYLTHGKQTQIDDLKAQRVAASAQQAQINTQQRTATCDIITGMRGTYSVAGRNASPSGTGPYNALFAQLAQASSTLNCDAG